jgi:signal transduction histidine kinase
VGSARLFASKYGLDLLIVGTAVASAIGVLTRTDAQRPTGARLWFEAAAVAIVVLSLLARRRFPFAAPAAMWLVSAALSFLDGLLIVNRTGLFIAGMGASLLLGNLRRDLEARVGLLIAVGGAAIVVHNSPNRSAGDFFFTPVLFGLAWLVGFALRGRAEQTAAAEERAARAEREREIAARVAVAEERGRIARELHDVVAHAVSVMVLQVGAVRHRMPEADAESREALKNVEQAGRTALAEMRRLLNAMRHDDEALELLPQPGLQDVAALVDHVRAAGLPVRLDVHGEPVPLPPGLDLSAYRIVQEGLTNSLKHSGASHAEVDVRYGATELELEVRDDGTGGVTTDEGLGHGLVGVRERVKIYGGEMTAGVSRSGGYVLRARIPLDGATS